MMRSLLISLATAASALAFASPAAAQYYPAPPPPPPGYGYGYDHGYQGHWGHVRALQVRINQLQRQINRLDRRDVIREREASRLRAQARNLERRLQIASRYGLNPYEANDIQHRLSRLEQRIGLVLRNGHRWGRNDRRWNDFWRDRYWDARDEWRDDRRGRDGHWDRDGRWDHDDDDDDDRRGRRGRDRDDD